MSQTQIIIKETKEERILRKLESISPLWAQVLKHDRSERHDHLLIRHGIINILSPFGCIIGEAHDYDGTFRGCGECSNFCGSVVPVMTASRCTGYIANRMYDEGLDQLEKFVNHFKEAHKK